MTLAIRLNDDAPRPLAIGNYTSQPLVPQKSLPPCSIIGLQKQPTLFAEPATLWKPVETPLPCKAPSPVLLRTAEAGPSIEKNHVDTAVGETFRHNMTQRVRRHSMPDLPALWKADLARSCPETTTPGAHEATPPTLVDDNKVSIPRAETNTSKVPGATALSHPDDKKDDIPLVLSHPETHASELLGATPLSHPNDNKENIPPWKLLSGVSSGRALHPEHQPKPDPACFGVSALPSPISPAPPCFGVTAFHAVSPVLPLSLAWPSSSCASPVRPGKRSFSEVPEAASKLPSPPKRRDLGKTHQSVPAVVPTGSSPSSPIPTASPPSPVPTASPSSPAPTASSPSSPVPIASSPPSPAPTASSPSSPIPTATRLGKRSFSEASDITATEPVSRKRAGLGDSSNWK